MKAQFKYALLRELPLRATALCAMILLNLVFGILGYLGVLPRAAMITGTTLLSLALTGIFVINIIADVGIFKSMFGTPEGYLNALTPVKSWKILLANIIVIMVEDFISLAIAIFGVVWQGILLSGYAPSAEIYGFHMEFLPDAICGTLIMLLGYAYIMLFIVLGYALQNSVFFGIRGRSWLALLGVAAVGWVFNLSHLILAPFGVVQRWHAVFYISLTYGFNGGTIAWLLLVLVQTAALFLVSSWLLERKNNL